MPTCPKMIQPETGSTDMTEYHPNSSPKTLSREKKCSVLKRRGIFDIRKMSEGRKTQVVLLDDRRLDLLVKPKLYSTELLDIVASHFNLKEKEYFGLSFKDDTGHHHWLHRDRKVLEHEFSKKSSCLVLYFGIRFFIESIGYLREKCTIELFFQQAKQAVFKGHLEVDTETVFELAAHVLQATYGDHVDDVTAKKQLKKLPVLPTSALRDHPSLGYCEDQVLAHYRKLEGYTRGSAIVNYMTIVESVPTYGIHYYEVKDKSGIPWWLGLSHKGIALYDYADKRVPRRVFAWKQLENLYFRDKKFSIEVHDPKRVVHTLSSFNLYEDAIQEPLEEFDELSDAISDPTTQVSVSRRTFGPGNVNVHAWLASTPLLTKCIWSMAVSQHQFYLDRKQSKSQLPQVRSMSEIASDLSHSSTSLHSSAANSDNISRSNSAHSLTLSTYNSRTELSAEDLEASRAAHTEMFHALQARKEALEEALRKKKEELKAICLKEGELTGVLPQETPLAPGEPVPAIRRRVGTSFALSPKIINRDKATEAEEALAQLELDFELQDKICKAAYKLAQDKSVAKSVRKQRKSQYHKSHQRLKNIEKKLNEFRMCVGKIPVKVPSSLDDDLSEDSREFLDTEPGFVSPIRSPSLNRHDSKEVPFQYPTYHGSRQSSTQEQVHVTQPQHKSAPASPVRQPHGAPRVSTPSPNPGRHSQGGGYIPNSVYSTRMQYRSQMYPTYSTKDAPSSGSQSDYENSYTSAPPPQPGPIMNRHVSRIDQDGYTKEHANNLYNVNTNKMACYDSTDELKSPASEDCDSSDQEYGGRWQGPYRGEVGEMQPRGYGSLDRNTVPNMPLQELSPSKFGSKRESHSDYRDSPFQIVDMPPPVKNLSDGRGYRGPQHYDRGPPEEPPGSHDDTSSHNNSIPYIDCSQSSISIPSSNVPGTPWYDPKEPIRPHGVSVHPQYESTPISGYGQEPAGGGYERVPGSCDLHMSRGHNSPNPQPSKPVTVAKYQGYVEVSKPFEMSDFYKYSERYRKQRVKESPPSSAGDGSNPQSPHHTPSQPSYPAPHPQQSQGSSRGHAYAGPPRSFAGPHSGVSGYSSTSSRSRPSSPFTQQRYPPHQQDGSGYPASQHQSSPYQSVSPTSGAQSSIVQTSHHHIHMGQQSSVSYQSVHHQSPKHVAYQPPKPMTCEPIRDPQNHSSMASKNASHRQV